jgi:membrane protein implicated in regulation of membrane protease activity
MWFLVAALGTLALALWLAVTDNAVMALPLVVVIAGLVRSFVRQLMGKHIHPSDMASPRHEP